MSGVPEQDWVSRLLACWERLVLDRPWWVLLSSVLLCAAAVFYTAENLTLNTDTSALLSLELPYQKNRLNVEAAFPQDRRAILLVVSADTPEQAAIAIRGLSTALRADPQNFEQIYAPEANAFFAQNGFLYADPEALNTMASQFASAKPFVDALAQAPSPNRFFDILSQAVAPGAGTPSTAFDVLFRALEPAVAAAAAGKARPLSWQRLFSNDPGASLGTEHLLLVTPLLDFSQLQPAEHAVDALRRIVTQARADAGAGVRIRATGETLLENDEMRSLSSGVAIAGAVSLLLVCATLLFAYRSPKLMLATFVTLSLGLAYSLAFATAAVGHLNLISVAFAVLFIGMGDAYSSHFCLRYRELLEKGTHARAALRETLTSVGPSLALCTGTAALGLYAFIPTDYLGVSELGIIAGTSLIIALATTFTILPALLRVMPLRPASTWSRWGHTQLPEWLADGPLRYARVIRWTTSVLAVIALGLLTQISVDFNPVNLRDPDSESVQTFESLLRSKTNSPLTIVALGADAADAQAKKAGFERLPTVQRAVTIQEFLPDRQEEKRAAIRQMRVVAGPALDRLSDGVRGQLETATLIRFRDALAADTDSGPSAQLRTTLTQFLDVLSRADAERQRVLLATLQENVFGLLPEAVIRLKAGLQPSPVRADTLPVEFRTRWLNPDGTHRIEIFPTEDLNDLGNLRRFTRDAQSVDASVSGLPVVYVESMAEVMKAFAEAFAIALAASALILLLLLRNWRDTLLVLLPLLLASVFTGAATVLVGIPLNFANVIALPLLFGLGIDSGIHMVHRLHYLATPGVRAPLFASSEAKGVFFGTLTTIFSFSSLAFIAHRGTASMGALLAIGLLLTLACALFVLPAFGAIALARTRATMQRSTPPPS